MLSTSPSPSSILLYLLFSTLATRSAAAHQHRGPRHPRGIHNLNERLLPVTATTTVVVEMTRTQTVWVAPTGQVVYMPSAVSSSSSLEAVSSSSAVVSSAVSSSESSASSSSSSSMIANSSSDPFITFENSPTASTSLVSTPRMSSSPPPSSSTATESTPSSSASVSIAASSSSPSSSYSSSSTAPVISSSALPSSSSTIPTSSASAISSTLLSSSLPSESSGSPYISFDQESSSSSSTSETATVSSTAVANTTAVSTSATVPTSSGVIANATASTTDVISSSTSMGSSTVVSSAAVNTSIASSTIASSTILASSTVSSTSSSASSTSTSVLETLGATLMNGYYPDWSGWYLAPESVDWSKYDVLDFAFALPTAKFGLEFTQDDSADLLKRLVATGHAAGKRVKLSIGGWTGSTYFSTICSSSANRKTFIANIMEAYDTYDLDGIDIDWEYPGTQGAAGNAVSSSDSANFLKFLTELRAALPTGALISTATQVWPFAGPDGNPLSDVSAFAAVIDWILIMNYDVWGSSSTPGANAPLSDGCHNSSQPLANAYAAVSSWTTAGMPANKITLGVPAYGYLQKSSATQLKDRRSLPSPPGRRAPVDQRGSSYLTIYNDNGGTTDGIIMFEELISQGAIVLDSTGSYVGAQGFVREWDSCSSTPWLRSAQADQIMTYDDPESMSLKGQFAAQAGIRGCNVFSIDGDWTGSGFPLTDAVRSGMGL